PLSQGAQVGGCQPLASPARRLQRGGVEVGAVLGAGHHLVVGAAHLQDLASKVAHRLDDLVGPGAVADEVAEHEGALETLAAQLAQHGVESVAVAVHVGENQVAPLITAVSAHPPPGSLLNEPACCSHTATRAATSSAVSCGPTS